MQLKHFLPAVLATLVTCQSTQNLTQALASNPDLSTLTTILSGQTELLRQLGSLSNITVIAPNNAAFARFMNSTGAQATANPSMLTALLTYHVLHGNISSKQINKTAKFVPTLLTNEVFTNVTGGQRVEAVKVGSQVVFYSGLRMNSTVVKAVSDRSSIPADQSDTPFNNGMIHEVDSVLTMPMSDSTTAIDAGLTSLAGALTQANLASVLDGSSDLTIFAPTNAAFSSIGSAVSNLTKEQLSSVLTYHVVNGTVAYSSDLTDGMMVPTINGAQVKIGVSKDGVVSVNGAKVVTPDVIVGNGVIHVIDGVLNPSNTDPSPSPAPTGGSGSGSGSGDQPPPPAFPSATSEPNAPFTSGISASTTVPLATQTGSASGGNSPATGGASATQVAGSGLMVVYLVAAGIWGGSLVMGLGGFL